MARETTAERQLRQLDEAGLLDLLVAGTINGELVVRGAPRLRHQEIVTRLIATVAARTETHGGAVYGGPVGVELDRNRQVRVRRSGRRARRGWRWLLTPCCAEAPRRRRLLVVDNIGGAREHCRRVVAWMKEVDRGGCHHRGADGPRAAGAFGG